MGPSYGISRGGRTAEEMFRELTGAEPSREAAKGDALVDGYQVEVKRATSNTLNQVRAVKYIPVVVYYEPAAEWYVVPAHVVVSEVSQKLRGQHTEDPFESATLGLRNLSAYRVDPSALRKATLDAISASDKYPDLKAAMADVLLESRKLVDASLQRVDDVLRKYELTP